MIGIVVGIMPIKYFLQNWMTNKMFMTITYSMAHDPYFVGIITALFFGSLAIIGLIIWEIRIARRESDVVRGQILLFLQMPLAITLLSALLYLHVFPILEIWLW